MSRQFSLNSLISVLVCGTFLWCLILGKKRKSSIEDFLSQERCEQQQREEARARRRIDELAVVDEHLVNQMSALTSLCRSSSQVFEGCHTLSREELSSTPSMLNLNTNGRLGNQLSTLAMLIALTKRLKYLQPYILLEQLTSLQTVFNIDKKLLPNVLEEHYCSPCRHIPWQRISPKLLMMELDNQLDMEKKYSNLTKGHFYMAASYFQKPIFYLPFIQFFRDILRPKARETALDFLAREKNIDLKETLLIGIHVRRGDMLWRLKKDECKVLDKAYFEQSMEFMSKRYRGQRIKFIAISDDLEWVKRSLGNLTDLVVAEKMDNSLSFHLALMEQCEHFILSHGTLGLWLGFLFGHTVLMPINLCHSKLEEQVWMQEANLDTWYAVDTQNNFHVMPFNTLS